MSEKCPPGEETFAPPKPPHISSQRQPLDTRERNATKENPISVIVSSPTPTPKDAKSDDSTAPTQGSFYRSKRSKKKKRRNKSKHKQEDAPIPSVTSPSLDREVMSQTKSPPSQEHNGNGIRDKNTADINKGQSSPRARNGINLDVVRAVYYSGMNTRSKEERPEEPSSQVCKSCRMHL